MYTNLISLYDWILSLSGKSVMSCASPNGINRRSKSSMHINKAIAMDLLLSVSRFPPAYPLKNGELIFGSHLLSLFIKTLWPKVQTVQYGTSVGMSGHKQ